MKDKQNITITLADLKPIAMAVNPADEEALRAAAQQVNMLWASWKNRYSDKSSEEVMALVAFQFARHYVSAAMASSDMEAEATKVEEALDGILQSL